ncbi:MAG: hypothetical protein ABIN89_31710 [Chitinophagaceae bacterium]
MKLPLLSLISAAAFITVAAFRYTSTTTKEALLKNPVQKQLNVSCSPAYIPSVDESIPRLTGWGNYNWKITTTSDSAQFYFNQGINMYYAFHIIEARASFDKATRFDQKCAMAWWGKALAFGPNINDYIYQRPSEAFSSAMKANELKAGCTKTEKTLIEAMTVRYSDDSTREQGGLNIMYKDALGKAFKSNPNNADVSALYAESIMMLHPWDYYNRDYTLKQWTPELLSVLKNTLTMHPRHPGANHFYVHAVEASSKPGDGLKSATFLATAMPDVSHITHMPSHIYIRTGNYNQGIGANDRALNGYNKYLSLFPPVTENLPLYSLHNTHMKMSCAQMAGNFAQATEAAKKLQQEIPAEYLSFPGALGNMIRFIYVMPLLNQVRFGKWEEILALKLDDSLQNVSIMLHFARGMALAKLHQPDEASEELKQLKDKLKEPALKEPVIPFNSVYDAFVVADNILAGTLAESKKDFKNAIMFFEQAVSAEDSLVYNEPRDLLIPSRQYLGNALLMAGKLNEAIAVYKKDLFINPYNGWSLTGIENAYLKIKNVAAATTAKNQLRNAWIIKDVEIMASVF